MPGSHPQVLGRDLNRSERVGTPTGCVRGRCHAYRQNFLNLSGASSVTGLSMLSADLAGKRLELFSAITWRLLRRSRSVFRGE
jgi:hypothetical protein